MSLRPGKSETGGLAGNGAERNAIPGADLFTDDWHGRVLSAKAGDEVVHWTDEPLPDPVDR
ncbi:hypothetical protein [Streptomyces daqingensis]|uniref:hypothetical protein n=1 Tax=Streptomyces daqingensis TaxID=1472640 RepID=UPI0016646809|nr:hypothetical protein [Streptomyces daqingensis]